MKIHYFIKFELTDDRESPAVPQTSFTDNLAPFIKALEYMSTLGYKALGGRIEEVDASGRDLKALVSELIDSADQEGCSPDLAVVDSQLLLDLADAVYLPRPYHIVTDPNEEEVE